jgi:hypothetical protein
MPEAERLTDEQIDEMTTLSDDVRVVAEWMGWEWCGGTSNLPEFALNDDRAVYPSQLKGEDVDYFTARILDKLEAEGQRYGLAFAPERMVFRIGSYSSYTSGEGVIRCDNAPTRHEAIVRAAAEYVRAVLAAGREGTHG